MQLYSQENEGYNYMLTVIDCFSRFAFAKLLKNKSGDEVKNAFQSIFSERVPKKIQTDQGTEFYNSQVVYSKVVVETAPRFAWRAKFLNRKLVIFN